MKKIVTIIVVFFIAFGGMIFTQDIPGGGYNLTTWAVGHPMNQTFELTVIDSSGTPWDTSYVETPSYVAVDEVYAGLDFDDDSNLEFLYMTDESNPQNWSTQGSFTSGASLYLYEWTGSAYELAWSWFDTTLNTGGASYPALAITDLDGDDFPEISLGIPYGTGKPCADCDPIRFYVWEADANGLPGWNGTDPPVPTATWNFGADAGANTRPSSMIAGDIDSDGQQEVAVYFREWVSETVPTLNDQFMIFSLNGDFDGEDTEWTVEYAFDGINDLDVGNVYNATVVCDVDGDGNKEVYIGSDYASFVEADAANTYTFYREVFDIDTLSTTFWPIGAAAYDADGDGKDEVYIGRGDNMVVINGVTDLATPSNDNVSRIYLAEAAGQTRGVTAGDFDGDDKADVFLSGSWTGILTRLEFQGGAVGDSANWAQETALSVDADTYGSRLYTISFPGDIFSPWSNSDITGDGTNEVIIGSGAGEYDAPKLWIIDGNGTLVITDEIGSHILKSYSLSQNYPNPFNPTTNIDFTIPENAQVTVTIYDLTGKEIARLANDYFSAGTHTVTWDGMNKSGHQVSSGVYIYSLNIGNTKVTRQMTLTK